MSLNVADSFAPTAQFSLAQAREKPQPHGNCGEILQENDPDKITIVVCITGSGNPAVDVELQQFGANHAAEGQSPKGEP